MIFLSDGLVALLQQASPYERCGWTRAE